MKLLGTMPGMWVSGMMHMTLLVAWLHAVHRLTEQYIRTTNPECDSMFDVRALALQIRPSATRLAPAWAAARRRSSPRRRWRSLRAGPQVIMHSCAIRLCRLFAPQRLCLHVAYICLLAVSGKRQARKTRCCHHDIQSVYLLCHALSLCKPGRSGKRVCMTRGPPAAEAVCYASCRS